MLSADGHDVFNYAVLRRPFNDDVACNAAEVAAPHGRSLYGMSLWYCLSRFTL